MLTEFKVIPTHIVIHHTASNNPKTTVKDIRKWHKERGFDDIGYHFFINFDGAIYLGRDIDFEGEHCRAKKMNHKAIGICLNGLNKNDFTDEQFEALSLIAFLLQRIFFIDSKNVVMHRDLDETLCPAFDLKDIKKNFFKEGTK